VRNRLCAELPAIEPLALLYVPPGPGGPMIVRRSDGSSEDIQQQTSTAWTQSPAGADSFNARKGTVPRDGKLLTRTRSKLPPDGDT
jgi:hypothetical protein